MGVPIRDLSGKIGETVAVDGWLLHHRSSGKIQFLVVRDGSGVLQGVLKGEALDRAQETTRGLTMETALSIRGRIRAEERATGGVEMDVQEVAVVGESEPYPIAPKEHGVEFLMDHRHLWVRSPRQAAILRLRSLIARSIRDFLDSNGFYQADPPILTPSAPEGSTSLFNVDYFGEPSFLSQSGQLYLEALAMSLGRVYAFGPTFRAERSKTRRHLTEFWMVEPEMAFCQFEENLIWQERLVQAVVSDVLTRGRSELETLGRDPGPLESVLTPFVRLTYDDALKQLKSFGMEVPWGEDLGAPHEARLSQAYDRPIFITHFPTKLKAFYMQPDPCRPEVVLAADLLAPEGYGEIVGGSERISDAELLEQRISQYGLDSLTYRWYLDLRRYGSVPHSGFGMGLERLVAWIGGLDHVRETIPFARMLYRNRP